MFGVVASEVVGPDPVLDLAYGDLDHDLEAADRFATPDGEAPDGVVPQGLDTLEPGPLLAAMLSQIDPHRLSGHDRIVVLRARQRMASHYAARVMDDMVAVSDAVDEGWDHDPQVAADAASAEIQAALCLTRRAADSELALAIDLRRRLPRVWASLAAGDLDARRARAIAHQTSHLSADACRRVVDRIIDLAASLTTGQLVARLRRLAMEIVPEEAEERYRNAVQDRRVVAEPTTDGTCHLLGLDLPPDRVAAATRHINTVARRLAGPDEARSMDQLRADVLLDLLSGAYVDGRPSRPQGAVDITVDLTTLAELDDRPGDLAGFGPVIADVARRVAREQRHVTWSYIVTDPDTGQPLFTGVTRRRPTEATQRHVRARYRRCVFPGCRMPARQSDLDHRRPWSEGGSTHGSNLAPLCRHHHHRIRHVAGWSYQVSGDGTVTWRSRLGHTYTGGPDPPLG